MVKKILSLMISVFILISCVSIMAFAENENIPKLVDEADILTDAEEAKVLDTLNKVSKKLGIDAHVLTITDPGEKSTYDYANDYYEENKLGTGDKNNGVILLVSLKPTRNVQVIAFGDPSKDYDCDALINYIMEDLRNKNYSDAFKEYADFLVNFIGKTDNTDNTDNTESTESGDKDTAPSKSSFVPYEDTVIPSERQKPRLIDAADLIRDKKEADILALLDEKSEEHQFEFVILTVDSTDGKDPMDYADDYYDYNGFGCGEDRDGALLLISMDPRYVYISTCGSGLKILGGEKWDKVIDDFYTELKAGDYDEVANIYIDSVESYIRQYEMQPYLLIVIALIIGFIIASIIVSSMKKKNISVIAKRDATGYAVEGSFCLTAQNDTFLYRNVTRTAIPKESSSSSSGGGSHTSSSGTSHGGGGRSF